MRQVFWNENARADLKSFPRDVQRDVGGALREAQIRGLSPMAKPFIRHKGHQIFEIVADADDGNTTYRVMYLVDLPDGLWVVHAFQKKSKRGIATPKRDVELVKKRVDLAIIESQERVKKNE